MGIEPTFEAWEAPVLPLNYTRMRQQSVSLQPTVVRSHHLTVEEWCRSQLMVPVIADDGLVP